MQYKTYKSNLYEHINDRKCLLVQNNNNKILILYIIKFNNIIYVI